MAIKPPQESTWRRRRHKPGEPFFVAHTQFLRPEDVPEDLGLDGSPYSADGLPVSEVAYWEKYYAVSDYHYEWDNGVLEEKPVSDYATFKIYKWLFLLIDAFLQTHPVGRLVALETAFRMEFANKRKVTIRKPDFFVVLNANPVPYAETEKSFGGIADLCVEAVSDSTRKNLERDTRIKRSEYELAGVREFFMLDASGRHKAFLRRNAEGKLAAISPADGDVIRSEVLPGFQFRVADLHRQPSLVELSQDELYRAFVLPELSAARAAAEQERARAERYAARLRALGLDEA